MTNPKAVLIHDIAMLALVIVVWMIWPNVWNAIGIGVMVGVFLTHYVEPLTKAKLERIADEQRVSQDQHSV